MKLIFAQGNNQPRYDGTRHNTGFAVIDAFAAAIAAPFTEKAKFAALIAETTVDGEKVILAKPTTFYNETGRSARLLTDFYKLNPAADVLVIHDELALPFGTVRTRSSGSDAGNNGIKSLNAALGQEYGRIRIGIYNDTRDLMDDADFVLSPFSKAESEAFGPIREACIRQIRAFITGTHLDETVKIDTK